MTCTEPLLDLSIVVNKMQEHHTVLNRRVDHLEKGLNDTNGRLRIIDEKLNILTSWTSNWSRHVDERLDEHDRRFESIDRRFDAVDKRFDAVDKRFDAVDKRFDAVDKRFEGVDRKLAEHDHRFESIDQQLGEIRELLVDALRRKN